jgi:uncharacterized membrane protein YdbT with pleckstrin-like domain
MAFYEKLLKDDEQLIRVVRSFPLAYFWPIIIGIIFIVLPFFLIIPLFKLEILGMIIFGLLLLVGLILLIRSFILIYFNSFIITNQRVIDWDQRGLFDRVISEADYDKIQDISFRIKGMLGTMLSYGTIQIQTAGTAPVLELKFVRQPQKIQSLITDVKRNSKITEIDNDIQTNL